MAVPKGRQQPPPQQQQQYQQMGAMPGMMDQSNYAAMADYYRNYQMAAMGQMPAPTSQAQMAPPAGMPNNMYSDPKAYYEAMIAAYTTAYGPEVAATAAAYYSQYMNLPSTSSAPTASDSDVKKERSRSRSRSRSLSTDSESRHRTSRDRPVRDRRDRAHSKDLRDRSPDHKDRRDRSPDHKDQRDRSPGQRDHRRPRSRSPRRSPARDRSESPRGSTKHQEEGRGRSYRSSRY